MLTSESPIWKNEEEVDGQASGETLKKIESESELVVLENTSKAKDGASVHPQTTQNRLRSFSPKRINACILSSENTRVVCSIMIALLVVFSNSNLPHHIIKERSIISRKPLYVMLLTDVSIVVGRIILAKRRVQKQAKKGKDGKSPEDVENWESAVKILEYGVVLYQMVRGIFIDCSFYMVIVTSGLSLV
ncbi:hypothetical protein LIER_13167 [Lithospermum erythrorhizon]|uniref:Uncharacterized protein n=1 Tax=Lithospermum erythrorhizon TaxID=34254 RepID=A0AAV3PVB8_LITER